MAGGGSDDRHRRPQLLQRQGQQSTSYPSANDHHIGWGRSRHTSRVKEVTTWRNMSFTLAQRISLVLAAKV